VAVVAHEVLLRKKIDLRFHSRSETAVVEDPNEILGSRILPPAARVLGMGGDVGSAGSASPRYEACSEHGDEEFVQGTAEEGAAEEV
jgi:hypothetical protein